MAHHANYALKLSEERKDIIISQDISSDELRGFQVMMMQVWFIGTSFQTAQINWLTMKILFMANSRPC